MRTDIPSSFNNRVRSVKARMEIIRDHPVMTEVTTDGLSGTYADYAWTRLSSGQPGEVRVLALNGNSVMECNFILDAGSSWINRNWGAKPYTSIPAGATGADYKALTTWDTRTYCAVNGIVYRYDWTVPTWTQLYDFTDPTTYIVPKISLVAVSSDILIVAAVYADADVPDHCKLTVITNATNNTTMKVDTWKGFLPKHKNKVGLAGYVSGGRVHIYVDDWSGKKPLQIRRYAYGVWGATKEILPMDALDDESEFKVGYCSALETNRVFLTGTLKRKYGPYYSIYMLGPEKFTFGRDLVIKGDYNLPFYLAITSQHVWAINREKIFKADRYIPIFSETINTTVENRANLHTFSLDRAVNQPDRLGMEIPARKYNSSGQLVNGLPVDLIPGARLDLIVSSDGNSEVKAGQFGIDRVRTVERDDGTGYSIDCTSYALKKLADWESDTYFDYMGQGEVHGDPGDLTKLVRVSGVKYTSIDQASGGGLQLESLNDSGMLYTTPPASHGGFIRCKFTNVQDKHTMVGVGTNYGEETLAEAAERLNKKIENVTAGERGKWALFAIYNPNPYMGPAGKAKIMLVDWNTNRRGNLEDPDVLNPYRLIWSEFVDRPANGATIWLGMQFQDGYARVYYAGSDTATMSMIIAKEAQMDWDLHTTEHENYGRGCMFVRNNTGYHMAYSVMSDSDVIPLYDGLGKYDHYGVPLEDRTDNFPTTNGVVKIDSEQIFYTGLAGWNDNDYWGGDRRLTFDLQHVPGKAIARSCDGINTPTGGSWMDFANSRGTRNQTPHVHGNNYLMQCFQPANGERLFAFRIFLKKVAFPEDGITLEVKLGNVGSSSAAVALINSTTLAYSSASSWQLKADGAWVTFYLNKELVIDSSNYGKGLQYWMILKRTQNWTHPSSTTYFSCYKMPDSSYPNNGAYVFCEEDDQAVGQSGDMAFVAYARVQDGLNKEYMFPLIYQDWAGLRPDASTAYWSGSMPTALQNWWNGCAITITKGAGVNNCYRIVRSFRLTDSMNDLMIFALDRDPGKIFGTDTMARAVPAFYGLKRGYNSTTATAHGGKSQVHNPWSTFAVAKYFEYYTAEEDLTLAEVADSIARKAGVLSTDLSNRVSPSTINNGQQLPWVPAQSKNCIVTADFGLMTSNNDYFCVWFANDAKAAQMGVYIQHFISGSTETGSLTFYHWVNGTATIQLRLNFEGNNAGQFRVSLYDGHLSAWMGGRLLGAVHMGANLKPWSFVGGTLVTAAANTATVMIPQAGTRVDNFVMDMGKNGASLLSTLVGEKRVYFRDNGLGALKIYTDRETVPGSYSRSISRNTEETDIGVATRVLLEGGEVVEVSSAGNLQKYGNFFKTFNIHEINNMDDAAYFANIILEDMSLNRERVDIDGPVDLRVEPTDEVLIQTKAGTVREMVVDSVSHSMHIDEIEAVYDMRLSGRFRPGEMAAGG